MRYLCLRRSGLVVFAVFVGLSALLSTLVSGLTAVQESKETTDAWVTGPPPGTVLTDTTQLTIREGQSAHYSVKLSKQPVYPTDESIEENHTYCTTASPPQGCEWWVMIAVEGVRRQAGTYTPEGDSSPIVSWRPNIGKEFDITNWNQWRDIKITALQDDDDEDEVIEFSHELWDHKAYCPPDLHGGGTPLALVTVRIIDDDRGLPGLSIQDTQVREGGTASFDVTLSQMREQTVTVNYRTAGVTATEDTDYDGESDTLTFAPGDTRKTIEIQTSADDTDEEDETFTVTLSSPSGATLDDGSATGTINDDDGPPELSIMDAEAVDEGLDAAFVVKLEPASGKTVTVAYATADVSAEAGMDYIATNDTLTFQAGDTQKTVDVETINDSIDEPNETFTVELSLPSEATLKDDTGTGTINDNDIAPTLSISDATAFEGNPAQFTVTLTPASGKTVTVNYATADGTGSDRAEAGSDYRPTSDSLEFLPGELHKMITVPTLPDTEDEADETFTLSLSDPSEATIDVNNGIGTGTITDDDEPPELSIQGDTVVEGGTAEFRVTLTPAASGQAVTVDYVTSDGTAEEGQDYDLASGRLTFNDGDSEKTISVTTRQDELEEIEETFLVTLSGPVGATLAIGSATGRITDDDTGGNGNSGSNGNGNNGSNGNSGNGDNGNGGGNGGGTGNGDENGNGGGNGGGTGNGDENGNGGGNGGGTGNGDENGNGGGNGGGTGSGDENGNGGGNGGGTGNGDENGGGGNGGGTGNGDENGNGGGNR